MVVRELKKRLYRTATSSDARVDSWKGETRKDEFRF
jgi:hypothetical protein